MWGVLLSPSATRALKGLIYRVGQDPEVPVLVRDIATAEDLPHPFLSKLLHTMRNKALCVPRRVRGAATHW